jgi:hypothetical protein
MAVLPLQTRVTERIRAMVDQIEELKKKYTDKYVVVDKERPELARFRDTYGTVKTVNMSGRALVEFAEYHANIGWYDIDPMFLTVVDTPPAPKVKEAPPAKKPAGEPASAGGKPAAKPAAKPAGAKGSVADILAAARGGAAAKTAAPKPAADKPAAAAPAAKTDRSKMSVADMLAAARAGGAAGAAPAAAKAAPAPEPEAVEEAAEEPVAEALAPAAKAASGETIDKKTMSIAQMCDWCRAHDTK